MRLSICCVMAVACAQVTSEPLCSTDLGGRACINPRSLRSNVVVTTGCLRPNVSVCSEEARTHVSEVRLGLLLPMFGIAATGSPRLTWDARVGTWQAIREINNKSDGVADWVLPRTRLLISYADSQCDSGPGLAGALSMTSSAFDGAGVQAIIGAGCSRASETAAQISTLQGVPIISPSSTSDDLSEGKTGSFRYFLRTVAADSFAAVAMVDTLVNLLQYSSVALISSSDTFGSGGARAFVRAASEQGVELNTIGQFVANANEFSAEVALLQRSGARVIVIFSLGFEASRFIYAALQAGIGGDGYLWMAPTFETASTSLWAGDAESHQRAFRGFIALEPATGAGTHAHTAYLARRRLLPPFSYSDGSCNLQGDDDTGRYLWASDHDLNATTAVRCAYDSRHVESATDAFGYDAVYALAHALHHLLEVHNQTTIVGSELLDALLGVRFEGVTGTIVFDRGQGDEQRYLGDRREGAAYTVFNYVNASTSSVLLGVWTALLPTWLERWQPTADVQITYSTSDNTRPYELLPPPAAPPNAPPSAVHGGSSGAAATIFIAVVSGFGLVVAFMFVAKRRCKKIYNKIRHILKLPGIWSGKLLSRCGRIQEVLNTVISLLSWYLGGWTLSDWRTLILLSALQLMLALLLVNWKHVAGSTEIRADRLSSYQAPQVYLSYFCLVL